MIDCHWDPDQLYPHPDPEFTKFQKIAETVIQMHFNFGMELPLGQYLSILFTVLKNLNKSF